MKPSLSNKLIENTKAKLFNNKKNPVQPKAFPYRAFRPMPDPRPRTNFMSSYYQQYNNPRFKRERPDKIEKNAQKRTENQNRFYEQIYGETQILPPPVENKTEDEKLRFEVQNDITKLDQIIADYIVPK